jgi:hypothetical protein
MTPIDYNTDTPANDNHQSPTFPSFSDIAGLQQGRQT